MFDAEHQTLFLVCVCVRVQAQLLVLHAQGTSEYMTDRAATWTEQATSTLNITSSHQLRLAAMQVLLQHVRVLGVKRQARLAQALGCDWEEVVRQQLALLDQVGICVIAVCRMCSCLFVVWCVWCCVPCVVLCGTVCLSVCS